MKNFISPIRLSLQAPNLVARWLRLRHSHTMSHVPLIISAQNVVEWWVRVKCSHLPGQLFLWSCGLFMPCDKTYRDQTWHSGYLKWRVPTHKVIWSLIKWSHDFMWEIINVSSLLPQDLLATNLVECWIRWRAPTYHIFVTLLH